MSPRKKDSEVSFEQALKNLEVLVESMENSETPLDELIDKYEEGQKWLRLCQSQLEKAEFRIQQLKKNKDTFVLESIDLS